MKFSHKILKWMEMHLNSKFEQNEYIRIFYGYWAIKPKGIQHWKEMERIIWNKFSTKLGCDLLIGLFLKNLHNTWLLYGIILLFYIQMYKCICFKMIKF